jgi:hypothetical protein
MPVSGPRKLYKIEEIQVGESATGTGGRPIIVRMKEPIAKWFGLTQLAYDDPLLIGTFGGTGTNAGYKYVKKLGGFRHESYRIVANTNFIVTERLKLPLGYGAPLPKIYRSLSIGFPKGISVREFINWIASTDKVDKIAYIVTPRGVSFAISPDTYSDGDGGSGDGSVIPPQLPGGG